jgi:hypothetical protein
MIHNVASNLLLFVLSTVLDLPVLTQESASLAIAAASLNVALATLATNVAMMILAFYSLMITLRRR